MDLNNNTIHKRAFAVKRTSYLNLSILIQGVQRNCQLPVNLRLIRVSEKFDFKADTSK